jgi:hypothetical protein
MYIQVCIKMHENLVTMHQILISTMPYHIRIILSQSLLLRLLPNLIIKPLKSPCLPNFIFTCKFVNHIVAFLNCKDMVIDESFTWWYLIYIASRYKYNVLLVSLLNLNCVYHDIKIF